jgi:hypothetical protein
VSVLVSVFVFVLVFVVELYELVIVKDLLPSLLCLTKLSELPVAQITLNDEPTGIM